MRSARKSRLHAPLRPLGNCTALLLPSIHINHITTYLTALGSGHLIEFPDTTLIQPMLWTFPSLVLSHTSSCTWTLTRSMAAKTTNCQNRQLLSKEWMHAVCFKRIYAVVMCRPIGVLVMCCVAQQATRHSETRDDRAVCWNFHKYKRVLWLYEG